MKHGAKRSILDPRDYSFHRSFGITYASLGLKEYNYDAGFGMPDQTADGYPYGCTGYAQAEVAQDIDKDHYAPSYTYQKTCAYEGHDTTTGCDIRTSARVGQVYGMQRPEETTESQAQTHRRGAFYNIEQIPGLDWFDSFRTQLRKGSSISIGTIWFPEWAYTQSDGIIPTFTYNGNANVYPWHNYKICGEKTINGFPYLIAKSWQGRHFGDQGWCYFPRETFNKAFDIYGTIGLIQGRYTPTDIVTVKITMLQFVLHYLGRIIGLQAYA